MKSTKSFLLVPGGYTYYDIVDYLKGFSIITIVLMHFLQFQGLPKIVDTALSIGGAGVHVFFFCSGFGLYLSYLRKPIGYFEFLNKRFLKIYIPYILVIAISALLPWMYSGNRISALFSHVFLYKMFVESLENSFGGHWWFISTLFQFYFLFILFVNLKEKVGSKIYLIASVILSMLWWIVSSITGIAEQRIWGSYFLQYLWEFSLGMITAEYLYHGKSIKISKLFLLVTGVIGIGIAAIFKLIGGYYTSFNDFFSACGYCSIAILIYSFDLKFINTIIKKISKFSYELYLIHILVFITVQHFFKQKVLYIVMSLILSLVLSYMMNCLIHTIKGVKKHGKI